MDEEIKEMKERMEKMMGMIEALQGQKEQKQSARCIPLSEGAQQGPSLEARSAWAREAFSKKDPRLVDLLTECVRATEEEGISGKIKYMGHFAIADQERESSRESNWIQEVDTDKLLNLITEGIVEKVLRCIGSHERLNLLQALLKQPMNVSQMMEAVPFNSTGQAYHHLNALLNASLVEEDKTVKGLYCVAPHRVSGIILLLAGIYDMTDGQYTQGKWEESMESNEDSGDAESDFLAAGRYLISQNRASASLLQRKFRWGYNRATQMIQLLEDRGVVSVQTGGRPRKILLTREQWEEQYETGQ